MGVPKEHPDFQNTNWSHIRELGSEDPERRKRALDALVETYQGPVYAYLRRLGCDPDNAAELTQAFFLEKVLVGRLFEKADPTRARLRSLLKKSLKHFRIDEYRRRTSGIDRRTVPLVRVEIEERVNANGPDLAPDDAFERRWAGVVLEEALSRCRRHFINSGRGKQWDAFFARTVRPILFGSKPEAQAVIAEQVGLESAGQVAQAVLQASRRMQIVLLEVVAETVSDPATAQSELDELLDILRRG